MRVSPHSSSIGLLQAKSRSSHSTAVPAALCRDSVAAEPRSRSGLLQLGSMNSARFARPGLRQCARQLELDAEVVRLSATRTPQVVFLPTATQDNPGYVAIVEEHSGRRLGCSVLPLLVYDRTVGDADIERAIRSADIIYVGGGNTLRMMKLWRSRGVDRQPRSGSPRWHRAHRDQCGRYLLVLLRRQRLPIILLS